jgi:CheY-like chemotaxis protein
MRAHKLSTSSPPLTLSGSRHGESRQSRTAMGKLPLVLLIEDHDDTRELLRMLFEADGCAVAECADGSQALAEIAARRPDLIMLDGRLGGEDGWSVCQRLRSSADGLRHIPVIFTSAVVTPDSVARAFAAGCNLFFPKPFDIGALLFAAKELLAVRRQYLGSSIH